MPGRASELEKLTTLGVFGVDGVVGETNALREIHSKLASIREGLSAAEQLWRSAEDSADKCQVIGRGGVEQGWNCWDAPPRPSLGCICVFVLVLFTCKYAVTWLHIQSRKHVTALAAVQVVKQIWPHSLQGRPFRSDSDVRLRARHCPFSAFDCENFVTHDVCAYRVVDVHPRCDQA